MPRVKVVCYRSHLADRDIGWQQGVEAALQGLRLMLPFRLEMRDLPFGVYPCIRATRTMHPRGRSQNASEGLLDGGLDRRQIGLELPTMIRGPVIFQDCLEFPHLSKTEPFVEGECLSKK